MLSWNIVFTSDEGVTDLCFFVKNNRSLALLDLSNCKLQRKQATRIVKALRKSVAL